MNTSDTKKLLEQYHNGACSTEEKELVENWLESLRNGELSHLSNQEIDYKLIAVKAKIDSTIGIEAIRTASVKNQLLAIAASTVLLIGIFIIALKINSKLPAHKLPSFSKVYIERHISDGWVFIHTSKGVKDSVMLPDGSLVTLDASSKFRYPVHFIGHKRSVYLEEGEALFDVAKDKRSPFTVYTSKFATTALGTAFNVRSYSSEFKVSISLIHGKIKIVDIMPDTKSQPARILVAHQQITLDKRTGTLIQTTFKDDASITAWKDGVLAFHDASMDEVINSLQNHYNITIQNNSKRIKWKYTGTFRDESLVDVLNIISLTEGISFTINKTQVSLN